MIWSTLHSLQNNPVNPLHICQRLPLHVCLILILIPILMMTLMVTNCQCPPPLIVTHSQGMVMISLSWRWYVRRVPLGFGDRVMCLMESCTLPVTFARASRFQNN